MTKQSGNYPQGTANIADDRVLGTVLINKLSGCKHEDGSGYCNKGKYCKDRMRIEKGTFACYRAI